MCVLVLSYEFHGSIADVVEGIGEEQAHNAYYKADSENRKEKRRHATHLITSPLTTIIGLSGEIN